MVLTSPSRGSASACRTAAAVPPAIRPIFLVLIFARWCGLISCIASFIPYGRAHQNLCKSVGNFECGKMTPQLLTRYTNPGPVKPVGPVVAVPGSRTRRWRAHAIAQTTHPCLCSSGAGGKALGLRDASRTSSHRSQLGAGDVCCCAHAANRRRRAADALLGWRRRARRRRRREREEDLLPPARRGYRGSRAS